MGSYEKAKEVDEDLAGIVAYTVEKWGVEQARNYMHKLEQCLQHMGIGKAYTKPLDLIENLKVMHCEHHYIFSVERENKPMLVIAVFHERMDLLTRLKSRLSIP